MHIFPRGVAKKDRELVLGIGSSVSNEEEPCYSVVKRPS